jgi:membrane protein
MSIGDNASFAFDFDETRVAVIRSGEYHNGLLDVMRLGQLWPSMQETAENWFAHDAPRLGASLAFYTILSMSPLVLMAVAIAGLVFDRTAAQDELLYQVQAMTGKDGYQLVQGILESTRKPSSGAIASFISIIMLLFGASGVFSELRAALNRIAGSGNDQTTSFYRIVRERLISFGMVLSIGFLLMVTLLFSATLAALSKLWGIALPMPPEILEIFNFLISLVSTAGLFALMFRYIPDQTVPWRDVLAGSMATALLFTLGKTLIGLYLGKASVGSTYGAAGSLMVITVWVYYSAQIFFFGAEFTRVWARRRKEKLEPGK